MFSDIKYFTSLLLQRLLSATEHYLKIKHECIYNAFNKFKHKKDIVINRVSTSILIFGIKNVLPRHSPNTALVHASEWNHIPTNAI